MHEREELTRLARREWDDLGTTDPGSLDESGDVTADETPLLSVAEGPAEDGVDVPDAPTGTQPAIWC